MLIAFARWWEDKYSIRYRIAPLKADSKFGSVLIVANESDRSQRIFVRYDPRSARLTDIQVPFGHSLDEFGVISLRLTLESLRKKASKVSFENALENWTGKTGIRLALPSAGLDAKEPVAAALAIEQGSVVALTFVTDRPPVDASEDVFVGIPPNIARRFTSDPNTIIERFVSFVFRGINCALGSRDEVQRHFLFLTFREWPRASVSILCIAIFLAILLARIYSVARRMSLNEILEWALKGSDERLSKTFRTRLNPSFESRVSIKASRMGLTLTEPLMQYSWEYFRVRYVRYGFKAKIDEEVSDLVDWLISMGLMNVCRR